MTAGLSSSLSLEPSLPSFSICAMSVEFLHMSFLSPCNLLPPSCHHEATETTNHPGWSPWYQIFAPISWPHDKANFFCCFAMLLHQELVETARRNHHEVHQNIAPTTPYKRALSISGNVLNLQLIYTTAQGYLLFYNDRAWDALALLPLFDRN